MTRGRVFGCAAIAAMLLLLLLGTMPVGAQSTKDPSQAPPTRSDATGAPGTNAEEAGGAQADGAFGLGSQDYWLAATQFHPRTGENWNYQGFLYFSAANGAGNVQFEAQVELPAGALVTTLECFFYDTDAGVNGSVGFWKQSYDYSTDTPAVTNITTVTSAGSGGYQKPFVAGINETLLFRDGNDRNIYTLIATMPGTNTSVRLRGCRFFWNRQVTPAPGAATFGDVPTSHPFFRFVEAMVDSGVTGGCGGGNYCPDAPLTRGQMAVFLAAALGLHWPY